MANHPTFHAIRHDIGGLTIRAVAAEPADAKGMPVVLVHGLGLSHHHVMPLAMALARRYRVYAPDLPGFGDSGKPRRVLDVPRLADALASWIAATGLGRAHLLGNSFGCQIIADLAARHPERAGRLVLQGPTSQPDERGWFMQWRRRRQDDRFNPPELGRIDKADYRKCGLRRIIMTGHYALTDAIETKLPHIAAPVLIVRGQHDPFCRDPWAIDLLRRLADGRLAVLPGVAHSLVYTAPGPLAAVTTAFLDEV